MNKLPSKDDAKNKTVSDIVNTYQRQLKAFIAKRVASKQDTEDILQDVFYQLSKVDWETNPVQQVSAWLYSVARSRIIDHSRKHQEESMPYLKDNDQEGTLVKELTEILLSEESTPEMDLIRSLIWEELDIALAKLPEEQKVVFELTELQGFSFKEISESTGIPVNTLLSRKRYAVLYLRKQLFHLYEELFND